MRTVLAVTAPFEAAGPTALTQSPTASADDAAACVAVTVVDPEVVILRFSVFGVVGFLLLELDVEVLEKLPGERSMPDTETVEPLTEVTLPDAMAIDPSPANRRAEPAGNEGRVPLVLPLPPGRKRKPPGAPPVAVLPLVVRLVQDPVEEAVVIVMLRAVIVVLDDFDGVPVAVMQSPAARELTASVTVLENVVVGVQVTVVCPVVGFCTSMVAPESAATLPVAPAKELGDVEAAPAAEAIAVAARSPVAHVATSRVQRRRLPLRLVMVCM